MNPVFQRTAQIIGEDGGELLSQKTAACGGCKHAWPLEGGCDGGAGASGESRL